MAVSADGRKCGYISGGCVDADVALQAKQAIAENKNMSLRYGDGSPFIDMPLPCGGAIDITILPDADEAPLRKCHAALCSRQRAQLSLPGLSKTFTYTPKINVRIAGRGADALALARLVRASGYGLTLQLRDGEDIDEAALEGFNDLVPLKTPQDLPVSVDDAWTAFILMFHDPDWETALLKQALQGKAFYVGAVGSQKTQNRRQMRLQQEGVEPDQIARVRGPVGLLPSMRDSSMLAASALAEIVGTYTQAQSSLFSDTAVILLAAGQSKRFEDGDKLLSDLSGKPLLSHAAMHLSDEPCAARIAVTGPGQSDRQRILKSAGWEIVENHDPAAGQSTSLKTAIDAVAGLQGVGHALILLADMPFISDSHLLGLRNAMTPGISAVMSATGDTLCPPAIFSRNTFNALVNIPGDVGARRVFRSLSDTKTIPLPQQEAIDVDTTEDLARATGALMT